MTTLNGTQKPAEFRVRGVVVKNIVSDVRVKGYVHHASKDEPQYIIKSEKTGHVAIHKGQALKHLKAKQKMKPKKASVLIW